MSSSGLLKSLRDNRILVIHPPDRDGDELVRHLRRIGCEVRVAWPRPSALPRQTDVVFVLVDSAQSLRVDGEGDASVTLVAIVDYEDPLVLDAMIDARVRGIVTKPIRPFGILSTLITARAGQRCEVQLLHKVKKLEETLRSRREIEKSVQILMTMRGVSENDAYQMIRHQAMEQRQSMSVVATSIIHAHSLFGRGEPSTAGLVKAHSGK